MSGKMPRRTNKAIYASHSGTAGRYGNALIALSLSHSVSVRKASPLVFRPLTANCRDYPSLAELDLTAYQMNRKTKPKDLTRKCVTETATMAEVVTPLGWLVFVFLRANKSRERDHRRLVP